MKRSGTKLPKLRPIERTELAPPLAPADYAIRRRDSAALSPELLPAYKATRLAIDKYEQGDDGAALEALKEIPLGSPFLDWKLFVRGLIAQAQGETDKVIENWKRLDPARLPAKLAAPLRGRIDPEFAASRPLDAARWNELLVRYSSDPLVAKLRDFQKDLGAKTSLRPLIRTGATLVTLLRKEHPDLAPHLIQCLYTAVQTRCTFEEYTLFVEMFPGPAHDPRFDKLRAKIESMEQCFQEAVDYWTRYEKWLKETRLAWHPALVQTLRANVFMMIAKLESHLNQRKGPSEKELRAVHEAATLAPRASKIHFAYYRLLRDANKLDAADQVATRFFATEILDLNFLQVFVKDLKAAGKNLVALDLVERSAAMNSLSEKCQNGLVHARFAAIRYLLLERYHDQARAEMAKLEAMVFSSDLFQLQRDVLKVIFEAVLGDAKKAVIQRDALLEATPLASYLLLADGLLAGAKLAFRKPIEAAFAAMVKTPQKLSVKETLLLYQLWETFAKSQLNYRGLKTHQTAFFRIACNKLDDTSDVEHLEDLIFLIHTVAKPKDAAEMSNKLRSRFPENPVFDIVFLLSLIKGRNRPPFQLCLEVMDGVEKKIPGNRNEAWLRENLESLRSMFPSFEMIFRRLRGRL